jgi:hypothetical protein
MCSRSFKESPRTRDVEHMLSMYETPGSIPNAKIQNRTKKHCKYGGWGYSSVKECLPGLFKVQYSIPSLQK